MNIAFMGVFIEMIYTGGVKRRRPALDSMHLIPFVHEVFGQIASVLASDAGDQGTFHRYLPPLEHSADVGEADKGLGEKDRNRKEPGAERSRVSLKRSVE
jgi:hypothetical protein